MKKLILIGIFVIPLVSCGVTKASISKPAEGTQTTITITTNNPISTQVSPDVKLQGNK